MTPEQALEEARAIVRENNGKSDGSGSDYQYSAEGGHAELDDLLCRVLRECGYGVLVDFYENTERWFS